MTAKYPHPQPCDCAACLDYAERLQLVLALNNAPPKALSDAITRQWRWYNILTEVYREALARVTQPGVRQ